MLAILGIVLIAVGAGGVAIYGAKKRGKAEQKVEEKDEIIGDIHLANSARDNLRRDSDERLRIREKYNRDNQSNG